MAKRDTPGRASGPRRRWDGGPLGALDALLGWPFSSATAPDWRPGSRDRLVALVLVVVVAASILIMFLVG